MNVHSSPSADDLDPSLTGTAASLTNSTGTYNSTAGTLDTALSGGGIAAGSSSAAGAGKLSIVGKAVALAAEHHLANMRDGDLRAQRTTTGVDDGFEEIGGGQPEVDVTGGASGASHRRSSATRSKRRVDRRASPPPLIDLASSSSEQGRRSTFRNGGKMASAARGYESAGSGYESASRSESSAGAGDDEQDVGLYSHARRMPPISWTPAATPSRTDDRLASLLAKMTAPIEPSFGATPSRLSYAATTPARARGISTTPTPAPAAAIQHSRLATRRPHASRTSAVQQQQQPSSTARLTWFGTPAPAQDPASAQMSTPTSQSLPDRGDGVRRDGRSRHGFPPLSPGSKERILAAEQRESEEIVEAAQFQSPDASRAEATGAISYDDFDQTGHRTDDPPTPAPRLKPYMRSDPRTPRRAVKAASALASAGRPAGVEDSASAKSPAPDGRSKLFASTSTSTSTSAAAVRVADASNDARPLIDEYSGEDDSPPSPPLRASSYLSQRSTSNGSNRHESSVQSGRRSRQTGSLEDEPFSDRSETPHEARQASPIMEDAPAARRSPASPSSHRLRQYIRSSATPPPIVDSPMSTTKPEESRAGTQTSFVSIDIDGSTSRHAFVASSSRSRSRSGDGHTPSTSSIAHSPKVDVASQNERTRSRSSARHETSASRLETSLGQSSSLHASRQTDDGGRSSRRWFESSPPTGKTPRPAARIMPATPMPRFSTASRHTETPLPGSMDSFMRGLDETRDDDDIDEEASEIESSEFDVLAPVVEDTVEDENESQGHSMVTGPDLSPSVRASSSLSRGASSSRTTMYATPTRAESSRGSNSSAQEVGRQGATPSQAESSRASSVTSRREARPRSVTLHREESSSGSMDGIGIERSRLTPSLQSRQVPTHSPSNPMDLDASGTTSHRTPRAPGAWQNSPSSLRKVRFSPNHASTSPVDDIAPVNLSQRMLEQSTDMSIASDVTNLSEAERIAEAKVEEMKQQLQKQLDHVQALAEAREPSRRAWLFSRIGMATQVLVGWSIFR